jgi:hypothetical protein
MAADSGAMLLQAFAVLQEKYVHARRLACCSTMDLIAVLTVDGQLLVHVRPACIHLQHLHMMFMPSLTRMMYHSLCFFLSQAHAFVAESAACEAE